MNDEIRLMLGDCLEKMGEIEAGSVDLILADLPYGTTACAWDAVIPFKPMWVAFNRTLRDRSAVVLTASQPFTSALVMSNPGWFKYSWVWQKNIVGDVMNAKNKPLKDHEDVLVFSSGTTANCSDRRMVYNPQGLRAHGKRIKNTYSGLEASFRPKRPSHVDYEREYTNYPRSVLWFDKDRGLHPTQKPVALMEYLIRTYSNPGELVLDCTMGSGTTGVACRRTNRRFIGIEKDPEYFAIAERRIAAEDRPMFDGPLAGRPDGLPVAGVPAIQAPTLFDMGAEVVG